MGDALAIALSATLERPFRVDEDCGCRLKAAKRESRLDATADAGESGDT
jgi:hypothetical protein